MVLAKLVEHSKADAALLEEIASLKKQRNAVILAHNYQRAEIQDVADFVGDSLELSQQAAKTEADVIVFCGVHFMAETASIISPEKLVLLPNIEAGCRMADMITAEQLREKKKELPAALVVCYVNTSAEVKAESDVCCTSANVVKIVQNVSAKEILFVPDENLGHYVSTKVDKIMHLWPGYCPVHVHIRPEHIEKRKLEYPSAKIVVHPECTPEVIALADEVLSTGGMVRFARRDDVKEMIIGTEVSVLYRLEKENPGKKFIPASDRAICPNMKLISLEHVLWSLQDLAPEVKVPDEIRSKARYCLDKMLELGK
jgi:quinolinate synthase